MKITNIQFEKKQIKLNAPIVVAFTTITAVETILIKVTTDEGIIGYGETSPLPQVTGETLDSSLSVLGLLKDNLIGQDPREIEKIHKLMDSLIYGNTACKAGIDIAMYDIIGKSMNAPLYKVLGGMSNQIITDITIGIAKPEEMAQAAVGFVKEGYRILKIKAGKDPIEDLEAIRLIREAVGDDIKLRMDANQGWSVNDAIVTMKALEKYNIDAVEQPGPYWDIEGAARIRNQSTMKVMLDESLHSPVDALKIMKLEAADTLNIKLMKSSGIYPALRINAIAESGGVDCMVGCMLETRLGISAAAHLVASQKNITEADVDSYKYFDDDTVTGGFTIEGDIITLSEKPGLGVDVDF